MKTTDKNDQNVTFILNVYIFVKHYEIIHLFNLEYLKIVMMEKKSIKKENIERIRN